MPDIKKPFVHYLTQLKAVLSKTSPEAFSLSLSEGMFPLEMHAKIAANFALRGYCPLLGVETVSFHQEESGYKATLAQVDATLEYLANSTDIAAFNDSRFITDKAGFSDVYLCESEYINIYIIPNFLFHISMVYAIAKANGATLSKGDFDGIHNYPSGFSFVE